MGLRGQCFGGEILQKKGKKRVKWPRGPHAKKQSGGDFRSPKLGSLSRLRGPQHLRYSNTQAKRAQDGQTDWPEAWKISSMGGKQLSPLAPPALCAETPKCVCRTRM